MPAQSDPNEPLEFVVDEADAGMRLDAWLARELSQFSRVHLRRVITAGEVLVDGQAVKPAYRVSMQQKISIRVPELPREGPEPEDIPLDILHEDEQIVAVNKPAGMVVHPAKGHWAGTLAAALAFHFRELSSVGGPTRPGIVHRLDRETSGVIIVAKTDAAHLHLAKQFETRSTVKHYFAITTGVPNCDRDIIRQPIGMHPTQREKMAVRSGHPKSRDAETFYEVAERFGSFARLDVKPKTGRTHQIRVHLAYIGCPVLCDRLYSGRSELRRRELRSLVEQEDATLLSRVALHARRIEITHPGSGESIAFEAPLPEDLQQTLEAFRQLK